MVHSTLVDNLSSLNVILIEDDVSLSKALVSLLQEYGGTVESYSTGESFLSSNTFLEAAKFIPKTEPPPVVILLDIRLPLMSGIEVFDVLKNSGLIEFWPVIFLTGHGELEEATHVLREGAYDFVSKPFVSTSLLKIISQAYKESLGSVEKQGFLRNVSFLIDGLTDKEKLVMRKIFDGITSKDIANILGNSSRTIELHRSRIFEKMRVNNAVELTNLITKFQLSGGKLFDP